MVAILQLRHVSFYRQYCLGRFPVQGTLQRLVQRSLGLLVLLLRNVTLLMFYFELKQLFLQRFQR